MPKRTDKKRSHRGQQTRLSRLQQTDTLVNVYEAVSNIECILSAKVSTYCSRSKSGDVQVLIHRATPIFQLLIATRKLVGISTQRRSLFVIPFLQATCTAITNICCVKMFERYTRPMPIHLPFSSCLHVANASGSACGLGQRPR